MNSAKQRFRWIGKVTNPKRDSDVYLLKLPVYERSLPKRIRDDLGPLREYLVAHDAIEHQKLVAVGEQCRHPFKPGRLLRCAGEVVLAARLDAEVVDIRSQPRLGGFVRRHRV